MKVVNKEKIKDVSGGCRCRCKEADGYSSTFVGFTPNVLICAQTCQAGGLKLESCLSFLWDD